MPAKLAQIAIYLDYRYREYCFNIATYFLMTRLGGDRIAPLLLLIRLDNGNFLKACVLASRLLSQFFISSS